MDYRLRMKTLLVGLGVQPEDLDTVLDNLTLQSLNNLGLEFNYYFHVGRKVVATQETNQTDSDITH